MYFKESSKNSFEYSHRMHSLRVECTSEECYGNPRGNFFTTAQTDLDRPFFGMSLKQRTSEIKLSIQSQDWHCHTNSCKSFSLWRGTHKMLKLRAMIFVWNNVYMGQSNKYPLIKKHNCVHSCQSKARCVPIWDSLLLCLAWGINTSCLQRYLSGASVLWHLEELFALKLFSMLHLCTSTCVQQFFIK